MHRRIMAEFGRVLAETDVRPQRVLEVGGRIGRTSLLNFPQLAGAAKSCVNREHQQEEDGILGIRADANDMPDIEDDSFDLVMSNAMLEHDRYFWLSVAEMRRVLRPGGLLIICVPGLAKDPEPIPGIPERATITYRIHMKGDFYRFTPLAVEQVFFRDFAGVSVRTVLAPPRVLGYGHKPESPARTRAWQRAGRRP
jgi:SAM-dependent methyltransferase